MDTTVELAEDEIVVGDLSAMVIEFDFLLLGFKRGEARDREKPIENTNKDHEIVRGSVVHTEGRDSSPGEEHGSGEGNASEEKALEGEDDGRILDLNPLELKGSPYADQEVSLGADESGEESEREGIEGGDERGGGAEEEGDLSGDEG